MWHNDCKRLVSCWSRTWRQNKITSENSNSIRHLDSWISPSIPLREEDELLSEGTIHLHKHWHLVPLETSRGFKTSVQGWQVGHRTHRRSGPFLERTPIAEAGRCPKRGTQLCLHNWMPPEMPIYKGSLGWSAPVPIHVCSGESHLMIFPASRRWVLPALLWNSVDLTHRLSSRATAKTRVPARTDTCTLRSLG